MNPRVHVVAPEGFDDPARPSGGNVYDRRVCAGLAALGWDVRVATVAGAWPAYDRDARAGLDRVLTAIPDGETVLIDGLIASPSADPMLSHVRRLRLTVLLHMPLATAYGVPDADAARRSERAVLEAVSGVVVTSEWTRGQVLARYAPAAARVRVARPGSDRAEPASPPAPGRLLCVAALTRHKGQDVLVEALAGLRDADWSCVLAGPPDREPAFTRDLRTRIAHLRLDDRIRLTGTLAGPALDRAYATAALLVVPSRADTYGMVVTEALARAIPVLAASTGGLPEALGHAPGARSRPPIPRENLPHGATAGAARPGRLVPPDDPAALRAALAAWLGDAPYRRRLRAAALRRRSELTGWDRTARDLAAALTDEF